MAWGRCSSARSPPPPPGRVSSRAEVRGRKGVARTGGRRRRGSNGDASRSEADRIIDAAFALVATEGWRGLSLAAIAVAAELRILRVYRPFRSKQAILCGFYRRVDEIVLGEPPVAEADERPRDR